MNFSLARIIRKNVWLPTLVVFFALMSPSPSFAACSSPVGVAGDILFNSTGGNVMQSCVGSVWKGWPKVKTGAWKDTIHGVNHSCGIKADNTLYCWGSNSNGQIGNGSTGGVVLYPTQVSGGGSWISIAGNGDATPDYTATCGIKLGGALYCWGDNAVGESGSGGGTTPALAQTGTWDSVAMGILYTCGIKTNGTLWCWGKDDMGQRGDGVAGGNSSTPSQESTLSTNWRQVSLGTYTHSCATKTDNTGYCWGSNADNEIGDGTATNRYSPTLVFTSGVTTWQSISAGFDSTCGIKTDGTGWCWGANGNGQVGRNSSTAHYSTPVPLSVSGVTTWASINVGDSMACGVKTDGTGWCWGYGSEGNIGDGGVVNRLLPTEIIPGAKWKSIRSWWPVCGIRDNGTLYCWGENQWGGLGDGTQAQKNVPTFVTGSAGTGCATPTGIGGDMLFNSASRVLQWCDGKQWNPAGPISPTGPLAGCTSPTGVAGDLLFNSTSAMHQYCDGDTWRGITP